MPHIYDNITNETRLGVALRKMLGIYQTIDVATGYFDLRGWSTLADVIDSKPLPTPGNDRPTARILVGMVAPSDSQQMLDSLQRQVQPLPIGADIHDTQKALEQRDRLVKHLRNQLMRGLASVHGQETLQKLKSQLSEGRVEVKVFTERPLHGKTYILQRPDEHVPYWSYVGSSNFTGAGLHSNLELNVDVQEEDSNKKLAGWFEERWNDQFSLSITKEVIDLINESWASAEQPTPFEVYLKVCHALSQDARDGMGYVLPKSMHNLLLDYQESAVRALARRIVRRGGTMLGDVVGLGKTLTAVATALMLQAAEDYSTLVLCPKNLESMWNNHLEEYDINGRVVTYSMAAKVLPELKRFNFVICDESHNLRNSGTVAYEAIYSYIRRNGSKVLLLTATPYNLAFVDVANQLGLYIDEDEDLGIVPSAAIAKDPYLRDKVDGKINTLAAFRRSEEAEDWRRLMSDHLVRRTRSFVKRSAKSEIVENANGSVGERPFLQFANGQKFYFPTRIAKPLSHSFSNDDPAAVMESDATLDAIKSLTLPRYRLAEYDNPKAKHTAEDRKYLDDIRSGRGNVSGFVRVGLFKRLSSSGHSFVLSLQRQRARNELFIYAVDNDLPIPLGSFSDRQVSISDEDVEGDATTHGSLASRYEELRSTLPAKTKWINSTVFKGALRHDLVRDNEILTQLLARFGSWDSTRDSKMNALVDMLRQEHAGEKVIIFTEYVDTAEYVAHALQEAAIVNVGLVSGSTENPVDMVRRFSPMSNKLPGRDEPDAAALEHPIDVLVTTDVLSEGQNLQDSHIIVNYDLPWAIIRMIQRAGRVDRVGQRADTVYVYLITHENIEKQINLRKRIKARLGAAAEAFGSDEQFFGSEDEVKILDDFYHGRVSEDAEEIEGEADAASEAWLVWSNAQKRYPAEVNRVLRMQDMVLSTRERYVSETSGGVTCYVNTASGVDAFATSTAGASGEVVEQLLTPLEAMRIFRAEPTTPTTEQRADHFERQSSLVHGPLNTEAGMVGNLKGVRKWVWQRLGGTLYGQEAADALDALYERPLTEHAAAQLSQARRNRYTLDDLSDLLQRLHNEDKLVIPSSESDDIRLVCSIGVRDV
ncbi:helicase-related protein [Streptomyces sp. NPDC005322]|uniref:helicase-related protein n=1 Tax=Streptomyces sp. NPDC005322 TaxID=3157032 RepID=UPI0033B88DA9